MDILVLGKQYDAEEFKFTSHTAVEIRGLEVYVGDCIKVEIGGDDSNDEDNISYDRKDDTATNGSSYGFAQVLAIFTPNNDPDDIRLEVRWFYTKSELEGTHKRKRLHESIEEDELVESEILDDIPAGSFREKIRIIHTLSPSNQPLSSSLSSPSTTNTEMIFKCRYFKAKESNSYQTITGQTFFERGLNYSEYKDCVLHVIDNEPNHVINNENIFMKAIKKLHISIVPESLPCRTQEKLALENLLRSYICETAVAKPIYISGMPGTGKTATVLASMASLQKETNMPSFQFIEINCLHLHTPSDAYTMFWRCLSGQHLSSRVALNRLNAYYHTKETTTTILPTTTTTTNISLSTSQESTTTASSSSSSSSSSSTSAVYHHIRTPTTTLPPYTVLLLDEIDFLLHGDGKVFYSFFSWMKLRNARLAVIGISNVMDITEKLLTKIQSRSFMCNSISFKPYNHEQIHEILLHRLQELNLSIFDGKASELLARKASAVVGDLRAALKICQRAIHLYMDRAIGKGMMTSSTSTDHAPTKFITHEIVKLAVDEHNQNPMIIYMKQCCTLDIVIIIAICKHFKSTGESRVGVMMIWNRLRDLMQLICTQQLYHMNTIPPPTTPSLEHNPTVTNNSNDTKNRDIAPSTGSTTTPTNSSTSEISTHIEKNNLHAPDKITMILPPYPIFELAISRLVVSGVLKQHNNRLSAVISHMNTYSLVPDMPTVSSALIGTIYLQYL